MATIITIKLITFADIGNQTNLGESTLFENFIEKISTRVRRMVAMNTPKIGKNPDKSFTLLKNLAVQETPSKRWELHTLQKYLPKHIQLET